MRIPLFAMERMQSTWENLVDYNLSESGVHPMRVDELLDDATDRAGLLGQELVYAQSNGTIELRERVAAMYPGATVDHVEITNGGSEANFVTMWHLVEPGDEVVCMVPNYGQTLGLAEVFGGVLQAVAAAALGGRPPVGRRSRRPARPRHRQRPGSSSSATRTTRPGRASRPPTSTRSARSPGGSAPGCCPTRSTAAPNSTASRPRRSGAATSAPSSRAACRRRTACRDFASAGLSGPPATVATTWSHHDYTTIAPGTLSDRLARVALQPATRARILARTRRILHANLPVITDWLDAHRDRFTYVPPEAGAIVYVRYADSINSTELVDRLRVEKSVLIVPGDHFGMDGYLRIGFGSETRYLRDGLDRLADLLRSLPGTGGRRRPPERWSTSTCCSSGSATSAGASRSCSRRSPCACGATTT